MDGKKVAFYTLGCRVNGYETESFRAQFIKKGYRCVDFKSWADVYVVNTCTVTNIADRKNRNILRRPKKINEGAIVVATGCYAQTNFRDLEIMEDVDLVVGQKEKESIADIVDNFDQYKGRKKRFVGNAFSYEQYGEIGYAGLRDLNKAYVKIQDGCDRFCSFCKIPFARGRKRSRELTSIMEEVRGLVANGFKEIVLIGIHLGAYGEDLSEDINFDDVVEKILDIDGVERLRVSSMYPDSISDRFIDLMNHRKFMPHLHMSIQSGDDRVLSLMRRRYDSRLMYNVFDKISRRVNNILFTGDVIVGFPHEEEENFQNTCNFIESFRFSDLHIFPYSDREKTLASTYDGKVEPQEKYSRFRRLDEIRRKGNLKSLLLHVGQEVEILVESVKDGIASGYTQNFLRSRIEGSNAKEGDILKFTPNLVKQGLLWG